MSEPASPLNNQQLLDVLATYQYGIAIHYGDDSIIQWANNAMIAIWGKNKDAVIGKSLEDALPELKGQPFIDMFRKVWREGLTISGTDTPADLIVDSTLQTFYFDFEYKAIKTEEGKTLCILHTATDVTTRYLSQQREQDMAEELTAINEELAASNEELRTTNEELLTSQEQYRILYEELAESNSRFRSIVRQAPVSICIIRASDLLIQDVNDAYLELVDKSRAQMENHTIWQAIPEAAAVYTPVIQQVINSGVSFEAKEHELLLIRNGTPEAVFVDFVYEPMQSSEGEIYSIMVLGIEVTEKVVARKSIEDAEQRSRLAIEASEIGTYDLDLKTDSMITSERFNQIFGYDGPVPREKFVEAVYPEDLAIRAMAYDEAYKNGKLFYESRIIHTDGTVRWIRVQGTIFFDKEGVPVRLLGTVLDITRVQQLNQQKDDFISIASHELKTPITSLKASLQLLDKIKDNPSSAILPKLIDQSNRSMQKISTLVEDLLNVSRSNASQLALNKTYFNISEMLDVCCNHVRVAGKYELIVQGDTKLEIYADEHAIDQVVVNLVNNAVKYAPDSLQIYLIVEKENNHAKISVKDNGPGIAPAKQVNLFERYYQVETSGFQNSGLGLGLYIGAEIIKRHGGQIGVHSELGKGSAFWFTIPLSE